MTSLFRYEIIKGSNFNVDSSFNLYRKINFSLILAESRMIRTMKQQNLVDDDTESSRAFVEQLQARIAELEDFQQRVESSAADTVAMAEELVEAKEKAETALLESEKYQREIELLARHDPLTGLSNRREFKSAFDAAITLAQRHNTMIALMLFDLDQFKAINDTYGHPVGDELLKFVAATLMDVTRETDTVARLGGDEFAVILTDIHTAEKCATIAQRVIDVLSQPVVLDGCLLKTGSSIGVSMYPKDGQEAEELMLNSDKALYEAKANGRGVYQFFEKSLNDKAQKAHVLESDLRMAIVRNEFVLNFQPQQFANDNKVGCAEALVRWRHPVRGLLAPAHFIAAAEENGLIIEIGQLILTAACRECKRWRDMGEDSLRVAVNISPVQFVEASFVSIVKTALEESGLEANGLELEITESCLMDHNDVVIENLHQLQSLGVQFALDDFGTGYSSLAYLKQLPIHKLKIDKLFIDDVSSNPADLAIVDAIIDLGHSLNLKVIAEGVEQKAQAQALYKNGCDAIQGFLISKPMAADAYMEWLSVQNRNGSSRDQNHAG
jgi:diguanylate cyclase (GGDEF)-like protein